MTEQSESAGHHYRIGAVARLTGLSVDRLRAWERRYGVVATRRSESMGRIYTRNDVERLSKLRRLVELGNAIGSIAHLSDDQLEDREPFLAPDHQSTFSSLANIVDISIERSPDRPVHAIRMVTGSRT